MKLTAVLVVLPLLVWAAFGAAAGKPAPKKGAATKAAKGASSGKSAPRKAVAGRAKAGKTTAGKSSAARGKATGSSTSARNSKYSRRSRNTAARSYTPVQQQPTPERYREIQQALIERGYLQGDPTGQWSNDSTDALRRFQQDQKLEATGKLDSLSLIALGLGPRRTANAQARP